MHDRYLVEDMDQSLASATAPDRSAKQTLARYLAAKRMTESKMVWLSPMDDEDYVRMMAANVFSIPF